MKGDGTPFIMFKDLHYKTADKIRKILRSMENRFIQRDECG